MLGNDIVDYSADERKYENRRFLNRILSQNEQYFLSKARQKNAYLWSLWAAKEAGYKAYQKTAHAAIFSPKLFELSTQTLENILKTELTQTVTGKLNFKDQNIEIQLSQITAKCVHCIALMPQNKKSFSDVHCKYQFIGFDVSYIQESKQIRILAQQLLTELGITAEITRPQIELNDRQKPGPPRLINKGQILKHQISLSHDNGQLAVVIQNY